MFSLGLFEIIILLIIGLIVLGPDKLPQIAKQMARWLHHIRSLKEDIYKDVSDAKTHLLDNNDLSNKNQKKDE